MRLADESFLEDMSLEDVKQRYLETEDPKEARKWLVAYHYKMGKSITVAADITCTKYETARRWIADINKRGSDAIPRRKAPGPSRIMTRDQYVRLVRDVHRGPRACGFKTNTWSMVLVHKHVTNNMGVEISYRALVDNLRELGVVIKTPRMAHPDEATPEERAEFRRATRCVVLRCARVKGQLLVFVDEAFFQSYKNARRTVGIKGDKTPVLSSVNRALLPVIGALGDGFYFLMEIDKANTNSFIEFTERIVELFGPVQFVLDHAGYHKSKKYNKFAEEIRGQLTRHFTLKYTPGDNSIEMQWNKAKDALSNILLGSRGHMSKTLGGAIRAGAVPPVAVLDYARVATQRLSPKEARVIRSKLRDGEHFYYEETAPPSRIRLPTAEEVSSKKEAVLTPEMLAKIPRRLAKSGLPVEYLANPPKLLLKK